MTNLITYLSLIPIITLLLVAINYIFASYNPYEEKISVFECGYHSFLGMNRVQFNISFFIFALLFLLFDLEILLIYPFGVSAHINSIYGLIIMLVFFTILTLGFVFELGKKALNSNTSKVPFSNFNKVYDLNTSNTLNSYIFSPVFVLYSVVAMLFLDLLIPNFNRKVRYYKYKIFPISMYNLLFLYSTLDYESLLKYMPLNFIFSCMLYYSIMDIHSNLLCSFFYKCKNLFSKKRKNFTLSIFLLILMWLVLSIVLRYILRLDWPLALVPLNNTYIYTYVLIILLFLKFFSFYLYFGLTIKDAFKISIKRLFSLNISDILIPLITIIILNNIWFIIYKYILYILMFNDITGIIPETFFWWLDKNLILKIATMLSCIFSPSHLLGPNDPYSLWEPFNIEKFLTNVFSNPNPNPTYPPGMDPNPYPTYPPAMNPNPYPTGMNPNPYPTYPPGMNPNPYPTGMNPNPYPTGMNPNPTYPPAMNPNPTYPPGMNPNPNPTYPPGMRPNPNLTGSRPNPNLTNPPAMRPNPNLTGSRPRPRAFYYAPTQYSAEQLDSMPQPEINKHITLNAKGCAFEKIGGMIDETRYHGYNIHSKRYDVRIRYNLTDSCITAAAVEEERSKNPNCPYYVKYDRNKNPTIMRGARAARPSYELQDLLYRSRRDLSKVYADSRPPLD
jgi:NADH-ubiquinone oxidoreductase chain 3